MPRPTKPYTCCRCGYYTQDLANMKQHFYRRKKPCSPVEAEIELTEEIKQKVLTCRTFKQPKCEDNELELKSAQVINQAQVINNFNTLNSFVNNIDPLTKLKEYLAYKKVDMLPLDRDVDILYETKRLRLENNTFVHEHHNEDILQIIDRISKVKESDLSDFNIMYDKDMNKFIIYESGDWQELLAATGVQSVIKTIKDYFWDTYECFIIRNIESGGTTNCAWMMELLEKHYRFLACVDVEPYIVDKPNNKILYTCDADEYWSDPEFTDTNAHSIQDRYMPKFHYFQKQLSKKEKDDAKKAVIDIIKRNTRKCIMNLNKVIISIMDADEQFKKSIISGHVRQSQGSVDSNYL